LPAVPLATDDSRLDLEGAQRKAAELLLEDEAWRDGLEDGDTSPLLDQALAQTDAALVQADAEGRLTEDIPYEVADQARAFLMEQAEMLRSMSNVNEADLGVGDPSEVDPNRAEPSEVDM
jgi:hypothetical protein